MYILVGGGGLKLKNIQDNSLIILFSYLISIYADAETLPDLLTTQYGLTIESLAEILQL